MNEDALIKKLSNLVIEEKKFVTYKTACSLLDITCKQSKELLKKILNSNSWLESTYLISGIDKDSKKIKYQVASFDKLQTTRARFSRVKEEHVYSLRAKPEDTEKQWKSNQDISEMHYKTDLHLLQNLWFDRDNLMSDQILLDHRYSSISGLPIKRTKVQRSYNLLSPDRNKQKRNREMNGRNHKRPRETKQGVTRKRGSVANDLPKKKRSKTNSIASIFSKAKSAKGAARTALQKDGIPRSEPRTERSDSKDLNKRNKGLFGFFSGTVTSNPFDAFEKEKSNRSQPKCKDTKGRKLPNKKNAVKKKQRYKASKLKRPAPEKRESSGGRDIFERQREQMFKEGEHELKSGKNKVVLNQNKEEKSRMFEFNYQRDKTENPASDDGIPVSASAKERRALLKAQEKKRKQEVLASRRAKFWGAASKIPASRKKIKILTHSYIDPATQKLVTKEFK